MRTLEEYRRILERRKGQLDHLQKGIRDSESSLKELEQAQIFLEQAQAILQTVAQQTQQELEFRVSELVTLALDSVFPDPYQLKLVFSLRRGRTEADLMFVKRGGEEGFDPLSASGGGPVDVASFALRVSLWSLARPRTRNTILLDEPFRYVSRDLQPQAGDMLKMVSEKLGIQFLIVTHETTLMEKADRTFEVEQKRGISEVRAWE